MLELDIHLNHFVPCSCGDCMHAMGACMTVPVCVHHTWFLDSNSKKIFELSTPKLVQVLIYHRNFFFFLRGGGSTPMMVLPNYASRDFDSLPCSVGLVTLHTHVVCSETSRGLGH